MKARPAILAVDDDSLTLKVIQKLAQKDFEVVITPSPEHALQLCKSQFFELIVSDWEMPRLNGLQLMEKVRQMDEYRNVPFLILSGISEQEIWLEALAKGATDFLMKPIEPEMLKIKLRNHFQQYQQRKKLAQNKWIQKVNSGDQQFVVLSEQTVGFFEDPNHQCTYVNDSETFLRKIRIDDYLGILDFRHPEFEFIDQLFRTTYQNQFPIIIVHAEKGVLFEPWGVSFEYRKDLISSIQALSKGFHQQYTQSFLNAVSQSPLNEVRDSNFQRGGIEVLSCKTTYDGLPGGDFIECLEEDGENSQWVIGDVMGKQWNAWFLSLAFIGYLRSILRFQVLSHKEKNTPARVMQELNHMICKDMQLAEVFTTMCQLHIDHKSREITFAGSGFNLWHISENCQPRKIALKGTLLGLSFQANYTEYSLRLKKGEAIILFTDGFSEVPLSSHERVGEERVASLFAEYMQSNRINPSEFTSWFCSQLNIQRLSDDTSLIVLYAH